MIMKYDNLINEIIENYKSILKINLLGIYLHGSYVMGGFNPKTSDIDFLVVVYNDVSNEDKRRLVKILLELEKLAPGKGFEMSMMKLSDTLKPRKPTSFLLHYSDYHKEKYMCDSNYICSGDDDPDLLTHLTLIKARGVCKYGIGIKEAFGDVESKYYVEGIVYDLKDAREGVKIKLDYYILNICRSLYYFRDGVIASKYEGGKWAIEKLEKDFANMIQIALDIYDGVEEVPEISLNTLNKFLDESFVEINAYLRKHKYYLIEKLI